VNSPSVTVTVTLDDAAKGAFTAESLTAAGFAATSGQSGVYSRMGHPADVTAGLRALVFAPTANRKPVGQTETTTFKIEANDGAGGTTDDETTSIVATSANDAPTDLTLSNASIRENLPAGTVVGTLTAADRDPGETLTYTLVPGEGGEGNASFTIAGNELRTAERFSFSNKSSYSIRMQAADANGGSVPKTFLVLITREPATDPAPSPPTDSGRTREVNVVVGGDQDVAAKVEITRSEGAGGKQLDTVKFDSAKAAEAAAKAVEAGRDFARIVIDDLPDDAADEVVVDVPKASLSPLANRNIDLEIQTQDVKITLPRDTLSLLQADDSDLYFRIVPIRQPEEREQVEQRVVNAEEVQDVAGGGEVLVVGRPMTIETNYASRRTKLEFPIAGISLPEDPSELAAFAAKLAVYVEHSDGEKALQRGEVKFDENGVPVAIEIVIDKFSTFTIVAVGERIERERYIFGYDDGTFRPERTMTRAEIAAVLSRNLGETAAYDGGYADVDRAHWAAGYIAHLREAGIMTGDVDGKFRPEDAITRAELAALIAKWKSPETSGAQSTAADTKLHWAESYIAGVMEAGFMFGYPSGAFEPDRALTRAEAVAALNQLFDRPALEGVDRPTWTDVPASHWAYEEIEAASNSYVAEPLPNGKERGIEIRT